MYLMYLDESGDVGLHGSNCRYFVLSALVIQETKWFGFLDDLIAMRRSFKATYGLLMREEIHAADFVTGRPKLKNSIPRNIRILVLKRLLDNLAQRTDISVITVVCDKRGRTDDIFEVTWRRMIQRFENTLGYKNFPDPHVGDNGIIISDNTDGQKLQKLLRSMRRYNPVPNQAQYGTGSRNIRLRSVVEDPVFRSSDESYIHQCVDSIAYFARQSIEPNRYIRKKGATTYYDRIASVINPHVTKYPRPHGFVLV